MGVAGSEVLVGSVVDVADISVAVTVTVAVAGTVGTGVWVGAGVAVSTETCPPPQAESMIAIREVTMNSFLDTSTSVAHRLGFSALIYLESARSLFKTSSSVNWIFQAGRWQLALRTFHVSAPGR